METNELKRQNIQIKQELQLITDKYNQLRAEKEKLTSQVKTLNETIENLIGEESVVWIEAEFLRNYTSKSKESCKQTANNEDIIKFFGSNSKSKIKRFEKDSIAATMKKVRNENLFNKIYEYLINSGEDKDENLQFVAERGFPYISNKFHCVFFELAIQEKFQICSKLMQYGIDPNVKDCEGLSILHILTRRGCLEGLKIFIPSCDVNQAAPDGRTPLHIASHNGYSSIVSYLCSLKNIQIDIKDKNGLRPIDIAKDNTIVSILKDHGSTT
ncbi:hypothetical protein TVAG_478180 [Trichomonas vaginalis G3]|uniref:Uncharacterized protein n=1 Tax=Trichomonas vaginalis (strain ATCC PRA-98 / G3) TaxID=412133 RepID=A2FZW2_TRIV3|nr:hypothetical protein TVAG_478180 [Trichomonas vaginalis G3]|eukprot:XP_001302491.1 hypothetical protein [Trichomonas vaginalis G3]